MTLTLLNLPCIKNTFKQTTNTSTLQTTMPLNCDPNFDEHRWIINIRRTLGEELEEDADLPVCIFNVPKALMSIDPDSYTPQQIAIGPYHHWRPELQEMERYKLAAAKRTQRQLQRIKFQNFVEHLMKLEPRIRVCYHKILDFGDETLAWMMAIDAAFLLEFLHIYAIKEGQELTRVSSRSMSHLADYAGRNSGHNAILRDIVMLENQIPLFILRKMLEFQSPSMELADDILLSKLIGLCKDLSPFKMIENLPHIEVSECAHLLDFLYNVIVPKLEEPIEMTEDEDRDHNDEEAQGRKRLFADSNHVKKLLSKICNKGPLRFMKKMLLNLPCMILSNLPGFAILKQLLQHSCLSQDQEETTREQESSNKINKPPLVEEITIPSVTELSKAGFCFSTANGSISAIDFDVKTATFYLPTVSLDVNTEVLLRNLVAYEASNASGPLVFTRYTELMNGIIDTEDDVKLLREKGVILNRLKSDEEAANLWNGMSKSIRLTKVPFLDKVIEDINNYYDGRWCVKVGKFMKHYVFDSWQFLTLLATVLLLFLMTLQAFCAIYGCHRSFHHVKNTTERLS